MTMLIGFAGRAGSGKSTAANMLVDRGDYRVVSFSWPLKEMAAALLMAGFSYSRIEANYFLVHKNIIIPDVGATMRYLLRTLGTEWGRNLVSQRLWVESVRERTIRSGAHNHMVFDDVRFANEAAMIRDAGGLIIHLRRARVLDDGLSHASEIGIAVQLGDVVIDNSGSLVDLLAAVKRAVERFECGGDELLRLCLTPCVDWVE